MTPHIRRSESGASKLKPAGGKVLSAADLEAQWQKEEEEKKAEERKKAEEEERQRQAEEAERLVCRAGWLLFLNYDIIVLLSCSKPIAASQ